MTNKRILGKKLDTFETYREKLIKYASNENIDGGNIENKKVQKFFNDNRLHCEFRDEKQAKNFSGRNQTKEQYNTRLIFSVIYIITNHYKEKWISNGVDIQKESVFKSCNRPL